MTEHKICKGCFYNHYPECYGTKYDGNYIKIDNLREGFECGQKNESKMFDLTPKKSDLELRMEELEEKTKDLETEVR